jgi:hypothetical protein
VDLLQIVLLTDTDRTEKNCKQWEMFNVDGSSPFDMKLITDFNQVQASDGAGD